MASVSISLTRHDNAPTVRDIGPTPDGHFLSLDITTGVGFYLPGYDAECAAYARMLAAKLIAGAERIEALLAEKAEQPINQKVSA